ncbi:M24 family metallopeptidase [Helicobacter fennelliae]|uniref:M24 family metallopeptidase n=1 Tax=Helicobacter fennelliae TaxID=215 RepID=UPI000DFB8C12|nr:M24 family metallopeptidase [Helicobacter fennelliae]STQ83802.1 putative proline aminopeptidase [Helicobacter fennelliae]
MKTFDFISSDESAQYYETGYSCDNAIILKLQKDIFFITDSRYTTEARQNLHPRIILMESRFLIDKAIEILKTAKIKTLHFDSTKLSVCDYEKLRSSLNHTELIASPNFHQKMRIIKSQEQIKLIKYSQYLNKKAYKKFAKKIQSNMTEKALYALAKQILEDSGEYDLSFNPILGINANAAKPHALPSHTKLRSGNLLLFDAGIKYKRYCSDRTRTAFFDGNALHFQKTQKFKEKKLQKIYDIVLKAQESTIKKIRAGMSGKEIDAIARDIISKAGFGAYFSHSTGHGIGLDIHELPFISSKSETIIEDGMVFSIEPGIYIPDRYGVRIEDLVVIKNGKAEVL